MGLSSSLPHTPPQDAPARGRARGWRTYAPMRRAARFLGRVPATAVLVGVLWAVGLGTRSLSAGPGRWLAEQVGAGVAPLAGGRWWTPLTSLLWCEGLTGYLVATALVA